MSEPIDNTGRIELWPLRARLDRDDFCDWDPLAELYSVTKPLRLRFKGVKFATLQGDGWRTEGDSIYVEKGYKWDGPSGPAVNGETNVVGSLVHDIICTKIDGRHPLQGYFRRHTLYVQINRVQGETHIRAGVHWTGLILGNWVYSLLKR